MLVALRPPLRLPQQKASNESVFSFLAKRFTPRTVYMDIGGALAQRAAGYVERVYAIDVSGFFLHNLLLPCNLRLVVCDGVRIPVPEASVDIAWGGAFLDQLAPDEARDHLINVRRSLAPGGQYILTSRKNLRERLLEAGFASLSCWLGALRIPWAARALASRDLVRICATR